MRKAYIKAGLCISLALMLLCGCAGSTMSNAVSSASKSAVATEPPVEKVKVPDISEAAESDGRNVLSTMGLIPVVEEKNSNDVEKGIVIETSPAAGSEVEQNSKVKVYVSSGPDRTESTNSYGHWKYIGKAEDDWEFANPYIEDGKLYIYCQVTFGTAQKWQDEYNNGYGGGYVSVNDTFDKTVPLKVRYDTQEWNAGDTQTFIIEIPLGDLGIDKPTDIYCKLAMGDRGSNVQYLDVNFTMTW